MRILFLKPNILPYGPAGAEEMSTVLEWPRLCYARAVV